MKQLAAAAGVPTARFAVFDRYEDAVAHLRRSAGPYVVKTDGLAAGKGVLVTDDLARAEEDVAAKLSGAAFGVSGRRVVIEEALAGREASLLAVCDGVRALALPVARDYKRALDGDLGPNTGGMGACSPVPFVSDEDLEAAMDRIVLPTLAELRHRGVDYRGVLYAGLMLGDDGPRLVEFNVRFGDPETEVVLPPRRGRPCWFAGRRGRRPRARHGRVRVGCGGVRHRRGEGLSRGAATRRPDRRARRGRCDRGGVPPARRDPPRAGRRAADRRRSGARRYRRGADDRPGPRARVRSGGRDRDRRRRVPARHRRTGQRAERRRDRALRAPRDGGPVHRRGAPLALARDRATRSRGLVGLRCRDERSRHRGARHGAAGRRSLRRHRRRT